ncbi:hypothetical protein DJ568_15385 [Mucilaginibacter hurinus]|uniref:Uncharacterized protein n=1 Tax=Mucilaginibacter hurinus TaxID=2201324 RepID=A0A367GKS3_9SPHI|nr:hypothetical protein [Mucilaginibacter hurinus]RCH53920.1 hypothetical protein DJ568_15385 [Mucilaginibacter hurinus]
MITTNAIHREYEVDDVIINFIIKNMPNNGYAIVGSKLGIPDRRTVRNEIVQRKKRYSRAIIEACLEIIEFVTGLRPYANEMA